MSTLPQIKSVVSRINKYCGKSLSTALNSSFKLEKWKQFSQSMNGKVVERVTNKKTFTSNHTLMLVSDVKLMNLSPRIRFEKTLAKLTNTS